MERIEKFEPPPIGASKVEDFDPTVHLEIQEPNELEEELNQDIMEEDHSNSVERVRVKYLHKIWLNVKP